MPIESTAADRILAIRKRAKETNFCGELPQVNPASFTLNQRAHMLDTALSAWSTAFNRDGVKALLSAGSSEIVPVDQYTELKALRKYGLILKSSYLFLDSRHLTPTPLHTFVRELGQFIDNFFNQDSKRYKDRVMGVLDDVYTPDVRLDFQPATDESYIYKVNSGIRKIGDGAKRTGLTVPEFHDIRKEVRHFMNIFQLAAILDATSSNTHMFRHLYFLNDMLGKQHDEAVQQSNLGKIIYDSARISIDPLAQLNLDKTLEAFGVNR